MSKGNIFSHLPADLSTEQLEVIIQNPGCKIERIVSLGHVTPEGECYDQERDEFVMLLQGGALISYMDSNEEIQLGQGDYLLIPAHTRHRVAWTDPDKPTIWLAVYC